MTCLPVWVDRSRIDSGRIADKGLLIQLHSNYIELEALGWMNAAWETDQQWVGVETRLDRCWN